MNLQLRCPFCDAVTTIAANATGTSIQCSTCHREFIVAQPHSSARTKLAIAGVIMLGLGLVFGIGVIIGGKRVQPTAVIEKGPSTQVKKEDKAAADEQRRKSIASFAAIFQSDEKIAAELLKEFEAVRESHRSIIRDDDPSNDPKDVTFYYTQHLAERAEALPEHDQPSKSAANADPTAPTSAANSVSNSLTHAADEKPTNASGLNAGDRATLFAWIITFAGSTLR